MDMEYRTHLPKTYSPAASLGLLALRVIPFALLILYHGWAKFTGAYAYLFHGQDWKFIGAAEKLGFPYPEYFALAAASAESIFSLLLIIGLLTRFSAAIIAINFVVAVYSHVISDFRFEFAALYLAPAIAIVFLGAGRFSIDALFRRNRREETYEADEAIVRDRTTGKTRRVVVEEHPDEISRKPEPPL